MKDEIARLQAKLDKLKKDNLAAWNNYGNELCAADMIASELELEDEIETLTLKLKDE